MTKHDRLMNALAEIKTICSKNEDEDLGCGKRCPFLMGKDGDEYRGCEIMTFTRQNTTDVIDTPQEWGEVSEISRFDLRWVKTEVET